MGFDIFDMIRRKPAVELCATCQKGHTRGLMMPLRAALPPEVLSEAELEQMGDVGRNG